MFGDETQPRCLVGWRSFISQFGGCGISHPYNPLYQEKNGWPPNRPDTPKGSMDQASGRANAGMACDAEEAGNYITAPLQVIRVTGY
jgi:hypothetical protein